MPYVGRDGQVTETRPVWRLSLISDIFSGIYDFFALLFGSVLNPPTGDAVRQASYGERHQGRSHRAPSGGRAVGDTNIRGIKSLQGSTNAPAGGGWGR